MVNLETIYYSLRNLEQRRSRSLLTIFSILIGIATIFIFVSFGLGLYNYTNELSSSSSANKVLIMAKGGSGIGDTNFKLTDNDLNSIEKAAGVYDVTGLYTTAVEIESRGEKKYTFLISYDPKKDDLFMEMLNVYIEKGRELRDGDSNVILMGYNYLLDNKIFKQGLNINDNIEIDGAKLKVIGFLGEVGTPTDDSQMYVTNDYFKEAYPEVDSYTEFVAEVDVKDIDKVVSNIEHNLRKSRGLEEGKEDFFVQSFDDLLKSFQVVLNIIIGFVILIALISVLVSAINTSNTMITSVLERYKEIGVLKAIGARNSEIFQIFLFESSFLGFISGCLGVLLGFLVTYAGGSILQNLGWGFLAPYYSPYLFIGCILFAIVTGGISGVIPAIQASRINTVDALRYE